MKTAKCTCRCTCKSEQNSDMDNSLRNQHCSLQISNNDTTDGVTSTNFTEEQKNMILKIEAYNREIIKEIERLQTESVKTNDAISLLKEHLNISQSSFKSPQAFQRKIASCSSVHHHNSSISGSSTSSSSMHNNSSLCKNDCDPSFEGSQQMYQLNNVQLTERLEFLRNRQLQLMSRIQSLKQSRLVLMHHMQQLYETQKMKSKNENLYQETDNQGCYECRENISHPLVDKTPDLHTSSWLSHTIKHRSDNFPLNSNMMRSLVDRECQTSFNAESQEKLSNNRLDHEFCLSTFMKHNSLPIYSNNDSCNYADNVISNTTSNISALAMIAAMTAATIFKRTFQQSVCQVPNTNSDNLYKKDFEPKNDSAVNYSILPMESQYWSELHNRPSVKKNDPNECLKDDYQFYNHTTFSKPPCISNRTDLLPPPQPASSSSSYYLDNKNLFPSISSSDTSKLLNSGLLIPAISRETELINPLESAYFHNIPKSMKIPNLDSSNTCETEQTKGYERKESKLKNSLDNNEMHNNPRLATSSRTRDRFSDRLLQARQAIDEWNFQKLYEVSDKVNQRESLATEINNQLNVVNEKLVNDQSYSQQSPLVNKLNFCKECCLAPDFVPSTVASRTNTSNDCSIQCAETITKNIYSDRSHPKATFTNSQPNLSKPMPIQIVKPAIRNHEHITKANDNIKQIDVKTENQGVDNKGIQTHRSQQHENRSICKYKDKKEISDKRQIKGVLINESSKSERSNRTNRNSSTQRSVAWVDEVLSHPLSNSAKSDSFVSNTNADLVLKNDVSNSSSNNCSERLNKYSNHYNDKNITVSKHIETHQPIKTIPSTVVTTVSRRLLPTPNNNIMNTN
ncbi:dentin phosphoryn, putative [Schistosoma mansoni]|uniref:dentin phosphoryn, putative n=1 Tax=Schistosoma mansoni TaxID=6183 RepID=UPI00022C85D1|nr:dentin phosphoryn, putative [Schistosoma mansoni]|eukprot:XP_018645824.1 dentin phosphoryn, putative [Schistosoma mansoni]